ncbi:MAG: hypothetical protein O2867_10890 [Bacteroidetes bacterium]|nr:hypothetical protein [Bacteroidota bacterium]
MSSTRFRLPDLLTKALSNATRMRFERVILIIAIASFIIHLAVIYLLKVGLITVDIDSELLKSPIAAIYTPFSFILIYEVYLLIFYLPRSITTYIGKQYEIITLIVIRRLFKDLSSLKLSSEWFQIKGDLEFTYDLIASLLLFYLIYLFHLKSKKEAVEESETRLDISQFIAMKRGIAVLLVPVLLVMASVTLFSWSYDILQSSDGILRLNVNDLFFDQFFTILILVDVILLLLSFFYTDSFHKIIRNSGFIISTILIRMSFGVTGLMNTVLIVTAVLFGLLILLIHNQYEKHLE